MRPRLSNHLESASNDRVVADFIDAYRDATAVARFINVQRDAKRAQGRSGHQNFFLGSDFLREDEVSWCRVLYWLLDDRTYQYAAAFKKKLLKPFKLECGRADKIHREHPTADGTGRHDILIESESWDLLIEAKVNAPIDPDQLQRYSENHKRLTSKHVSGLLLTGPEVEAFLDRNSDGKIWEHITWPQLADYLQTTLSLEGEPAIPVQVSPSLAQARWEVVALDFIDVIRSKWTST